MAIGNDIVDWNVVRQNPKSSNPKFLKKVLTDSELAVVKKSNNPELALWVHWALKESAYKADFQIHQKRYFAPKKLVCVLSSANQSTAKITTPFHEYIGRINITKDYIHAIVVPYSNTFDVVEHQAILIPSFTNSSKIIRDNLKNYLIQKHFIDKDTIIIKKEKDVPLLLIQGKNYPISFSHHGKWGAWTIKKPSATKQMAQIF